MKILCSISTRGRYETTLPLTIQSVINQEKVPDHLVIFDDNDEPKDLREMQVYSYLFQILNEKGISWQVLFGAKKGQHFNHQMANMMGYDLVWRLDDDTIAEKNTLKNLYSYIQNHDDVGAVGGSVLTPPYETIRVACTGLIHDIWNEPNLQWDHIRVVKEVDHLHCSFLYRAGICDYNLALSRAAHREETLFTYAFRQKGYRLLVVPDAIVWHLKNREGGIRTSTKEMFDHDEQIFTNILGLKDYTPVVLDCGLGDHVVFKRVLKDIKNPVVFSCYPEIIPGKSIAEAIQRFGDINSFNVYTKMDQWKWKGSLEDAFRKLYGVEK